MSEEFLCRRGKLNCFVFVPPDNDEEKLENLSELQEMDLLVEGYLLSLQS